MTPLFVDTSALYAVLDRDDRNHPKARTAWSEVLENDRTLVTTNYVLVETSALVQHRLGIGALRTIHEDIVPLIRVEWVDSNRHGTGLATLLTAGRKKLSLVDCVSFAVMRELGLREALCFDADFAEQGFRCLP